MDNPTRQKLLKFASRDGAFPQRCAASCTNVFMQFAVEQHQQQPLAHRLRTPTARAEQFASNEFAKLLAHTRDNP